MTTAQFNKVLEDRIKKMRSSIGTKRKEYASDNDVFHNFNVAGNMLGVDRKEALLGMAAKHLVSIFDLAKNDKFDVKVVDEKIGDAINYFVLLEAMFIEDDMDTLV